MFGVGGEMPMRGRFRQRRNRPTFDHAMVMRSREIDLTRESGRQRPTPYVYVLKATSTWSAPDRPTVSPPSTNMASPVDSDGWKGWWPEAPDNAAATYQIPDLPKIDPVVTATSAFPFVWKCKAEVGDLSWENPVLFEAVVHADVRDLSAKEAVEGSQNITFSFARMWFRTADVNALSTKFNPQQWDLRELVSERTWAIEGVVPSWEMRRYTQMICQSRRGGASR